jgi:type II secretory pathway pseudopilin PulG
MDKVVVVFVIIGILLVIGLWIVSNKTDTFVVAFNNDFVPENPIKTIDSMQNDALYKIFSSSPPINVDNTFLSYNDNIAFPLNNLFKYLALEYFNKNATQFSKDKVYISNDMNNIYYKKDPVNESTLYIANFTLINPKELFSKNIKIGVNYIYPNGKILFMQLDTLPSPDLDKVNIESIDKLKPDYYTLKNKMFLMDPWATSDDSMAISDIYINNFNKVLQDKNKQLLSINPLISI